MLAKLTAFQPGKVNIKTLILTTVYTLASVVVALMISWQLLKQINFSYGFWHDNAKIGWAIDKYGPQNYYKLGFGQTTREQRIDLFRQINEAVHSGGKGLAEIRYEVYPYPKQRLLRTAEVIHLQDVANFIDKCMVAGWIGIILWFVLLLYYYLNKTSPPKIRKQLLALIGVVLFSTVLIFILGPTEVFTVFHEVVFPQGNWFFYYQASLMSTMMWAPRLFGWIAIEWVIFTIVTFTVTQYAAQLLLKKLMKRT